MGMVDRRMGAWLQARVRGTVPTGARGAAREAAIEGLLDQAAHARATTGRRDVTRKALWRAATFADGDARALSMVAGDATLMDHGAFGHGVLGRAVAVAATPAEARHVAARARALGFDDLAAAARARAERLPTPSWPARLAAWWRTTRFA